MVYFALSDTHAHYTLVRKALHEAGFFDSPHHMLILCGDILDRGNEAVALSDFLAELYQKGQVICITGNHESLFISMLQAIASGRVGQIAEGDSHHYRNGTWDTALQLAKMDAEEAVRFPIQLIRRVMDTSFYQYLLPNGVDYYETANYIFTHGYIPCHADIATSSPTYTYNPLWRDASPGEWEKARWLNGMEMAGVFHITEPNKTIVCGHHTVSYGHSLFEGKGSHYGRDAVFTPYAREGLLAIDAATVTSGKVNVVRIEDSPL